MISRPDIQKRMSGCSNASASSRCPVFDSSRYRSTVSSSLLIGRP